jgi:tRNA A58 N-methylase Trm61
MINYIGDISKADANILADLAEQSENILEFGVGASTQVLAAYGKGKVTTTETSMEWVEKTKQNLKLLGIEKEVVDSRYAYKPRSTGGARLHEGEISGNRIYLYQQRSFKYYCD